MSLTQKREKPTPLVLSYEFKRIARIETIVFYIKLHPIVRSLVDISLNVAIAIAIEIHIDNVVFNIPVARFVESIGAYYSEGAIAIEHKSVIAIIGAFAQSNIYIAHIPPTCDTHIVIVQPKFFTRGENEGRQQQQKAER